MIISTLCISSVFEADSFTTILLNKILNGVRDGLGRIKRQKMLTRSGTNPSTVPEIGAKTSHEFTGHSRSRLSIEEKLRQFGVA